MVDHLVQNQGLSCVIVISRMRAQISRTHPRYRGRDLRLRGHVLNDKHIFSKLESVSSNFQDPHMDLIGIALIRTGSSFWLLLVPQISPKYPHEVAHFGANFYPVLIYRYCLHSPRSKLPSTVPKISPIGKKKGWTRMPSPPFFHPPDRLLRTDYLTEWLCIHTRFYDHHYTGMVLHTAYTLYCKKILVNKLCLYICNLSSG